MGYRIVIPTAGIGSRLKEFTRYINKSLVGIANRPTISHLIEQFPQDCEFVIALGHKGELVRNFLELAYPDRTFFFANVDPYKGKGSGLGLSLLACEQYLQEPFVFLSCDTLVKELIPEPDNDWMGFSQIEDLAQYRTLNVVNGNVAEICEKGAIRENLKAYIGLTGVHSYRKFWQAMHSGGTLAIDRGESYGMKSILVSNNVTTHEFTWFDTGNLESIQIVREVYAKPGEPNILEKKNEAIWFVGNNVVKYSDDIDFITNRVKRAKELQEFVPNIYTHKSNMYCYKKVNGEVLSDVINPAIFELFLTKCKDDIWRAENRHLLAVNAKDNLEYLMADDKDNLKMLVDSGKILIEALTYIRGRSISNAFIIIDEAQNLTYHELKTIITRVGEGTKIILTGDIEQIDNAYIDETSNGLTYAVEKFKSHSLAGHVTLLRGERSAVATLASKIL